MLILHSSRCWVFFRSCLVWIFFVFCQKQPQPKTTNEKQKYVKSKEMVNLWLIKLLLVEIWFQVKTNDTVYWELTVLSESNWSRATLIANVWHFRVQHNKGEHCTSECSYHIQIYIYLFGWGIYLSVATFFYLHLKAVCIQISRLLYEPSDKDPHCSTFGFWI